nr:hypothetical protein [Tanacetum cinerariifolium]
MPPKPDLVFNTAHIAVETAHSAFTIKLSSFEPTQDLSHTNRPSTPIIEDWVSDSEDDSETTAPQIAYSFVQSTKQVTPPRHFVQPVEAPILADTPKPTSLNTSSSGKRKNRKTCFVCRSVDHLIKDCNYHAMKKAQPTPRNYVHRGTHKQNASFTRHHPQIHMVPAIVLTQSKPISTAVRPICAAVPKIMVTRPRHAHSIETKSKSTFRRHITHGQSLKISNLSPRVTVAQAPVVSAAKGKKEKWVSILVLQKYESPVLACAISEVLSSLAEDTSTMLSLILPFILDSSKIKLERKSSTNEDIYGIQTRPQIDMMQALSSSHVKAPSSMQIHHEPLSCALQLVCVLKTSTFILVGQSGQHKSATDDLEVICKIGETLASASSLQFVKEKVTWNPKKTSKELKKEP